MRDRSPRDCDPFCCAITVSFCYESPASARRFTWLSGRVRIGWLCPAGRDGPTDGTRKQKGKRKETCTMKKRAVMMTCAAFVLLSATTPAFAGQWLSDANSWQWLDGNRDGVAECYYFDGRGYCMTSTTTPDGYQVDQDGAWVVGGSSRARPRRCLCHSRPVFLKVLPGDCSRWQMLSIGLHVPLRRM